MTQDTNTQGQVPEALQELEVRKLAAIGPVHTSSGLVERRPIEYRRELEDQFVRGYRAAEKRLHAQVAALTQPAQVNTKTHDLLSMMIGLFLGAKETIGYKPGGAIDNIVAEAVEHLKDWPYPDTVQVSAVESNSAGAVLTDEDIEAIALEQIGFDGGLQAVNGMDIKRIVRAAERKIASHGQAPATQQAGEMEVFGLQWPGEDRINLSTVFDTETEALEYMQNRCDTPGIRLVRFSSNAPTAQAAGSVPAVEREQERIAFKDAHRHLELYEVPDAWGRPMFKHSHVEASWLGWIARASHGQAPAPTHEQIAAYLESTGAYVTNDATREAAIAEAIDTDRAKRGQAPATEDSVLEDAMRYRWLAEHCRSTSEHWGGRWSIVVEGPAPKSHDSEDDFDAAIDAGRKQGANHD